jgi:FtsZ-interacting cell division protein ZipA
MSELQIGLVAVGVLVVAGVLAYNRLQERGARRDAERAFRSGHVDVLLDDGPLPERATPVEPPRGPARQAADAPATGAVPDPAIDYLIEFASDQPAAQATVREQWPAIERRHAPRALLGAGADGRSWRAGLQLVSRDGAVGEADLIEFRSAVETLAAAVGATVAAPEMRAAVEAARALDAFCAEADIQVVVHVQGGPFAGTKVRAAAEAHGLQLEADGKFALRNDEGTLLYTLGMRDGAPFARGAMRESAPQALTLALDVGRTPDTRRSFESMTRLAHQLAASLGGTMVDDNDRPLDERAVAAIAQQLDEVRARLEARGVPPGGPAALRLFS